MTVSAATGSDELEQAGKYALGAALRAVSGGASGGPELIPRCPIRAGSGDRPVAFWS